MSSNIGITRNERVAIVKRILNMPTLSNRDMIDLMRISRDIDADYAKISNELVPDSGIFLNSRHMEQFVSADISDNFVVEEVRKQKLYFRRLRDLLPEFLHFFDFERDEQVLSFMEIIDDCHHDFWIIQGSTRRDKSRRQAIEAIDLARQKFSELINVLGDAKRYIDIEYDNLRRLCFEMPYLAQAPDMNFENLFEELKFAYGAIDLCSMRAQEDKEFLILTDSKFRTHVVETAYTMSLYYSGPPFRTTPGSDFSACAGVLFEVVSEKSDVSLAGAINRFARSKEKQEHDKFNIETPDNNDGALQGNNFRSVNLPIIHVANEYIRYANMPGVPILSSEAKMIVWKLWQKMTFLSEESKKKFGPFIENAETNPSLNTEERIKEYDRLRAELKKLVISLGNSRREDPAGD